LPDVVCHFLLAKKILQYSFFIKKTKAFSKFNKV